MFVFLTTYINIIPNFFTKNKKEANLLTTFDKNKKILYNNKKRM